MRRRRLIVPKDQYEARLGYADRDSGTLFGNIRRLPDGAITAGQDVAVDYKIYNDHIFKDDGDDKMWGYRRTPRFSKSREDWGFQ